MIDGLHTRNEFDHVMRLSTHGEARKRHITLPVTNLASALSRAATGCWDRNR
jgi:hypothetical protein